MGERSTRTSVVAGRGLTRPTVWPVTRPPLIGSLTGRPAPLAIALLVVLRIGFAAIALLARSAGPYVHAGVAWSDLVLPDDTLAGALLSPFQRWDALWYQHIAESGYEPGDGSFVFFPLYPLVVRGVATVAGNVVLAELIVSSAAFVVAMWAVFQLASDERSTSSAATGALTVALVALFPTGFFLLAPYSEGLFLAASAASFLALRSGRPLLAGVAAAAASFTRVQGVLLVLPLAVDALVRSRGRPQPQLATALLPLLGIISMSAYASALGERRSLAALQDLWGVRVVAPWQAIADSVAYISRTGDLFEIIDIASLLAFVVITIAFARRMPISWLVYAAAALAILLTRELGNMTPLMSDSRYVLVLFPVFVMAARALERRPRLAAAILVASALVEATLFAAWTRWAFVG